MNIGIDIGGSHIAVGLVDQEKLITKIEEDIQIKADIKKTIVEKLIKKIDKILEENSMQIEEIEFIGIGTPGVAKDGTIYNMVNFGIEEFQISKMLKEKYKNTTIKIKNDAKCAAIAEFKYGCIKNYKDAVFLTIGTGIGSAIFLNNQLLEAKTYPGFELGHMIIEKGGKKCRCGQNGCFETYASMKTLKQEIKSKYNLGENTTSKEIVNIIKKDIEKEKMSKIIEEYISYFATGIANIINTFEPEIIGLGGSIVYTENIIIEKVKQEIKNKNLLFNKRSNITIKNAALGNSAGIIGAANL